MPEQVTGIHYRIADTTGFDVRTVMLWSTLALLAVMVSSILEIFGRLIITTMQARISRKARVQESRYLRHQGNMLTLMVEALTNVRQVKHFGLETYHRNNFDKEGEILIQTRRMATLIKSLSAPIAELVLGLLLLAMIAIAYYQVTHELTTTSAIAGCLVAALSIRRPISGLSRSIVELQRAFAAIHRIRWTVSAYNRETGGQKTDVPIQSIELDKVSFSYDGRRDILKQVSLAIGKGEHIAIMGKSGAGKTTLSDLINGFYPCTAGDIRVNGISMAQLDPAHWRDIIGIVSQEPFLFNLSIKDNIRLGNFSVSDPEIEEALKAAGCGEMLERLPDGIDSMVGERGGVLSGGERKRVALARIFVRKPALMILDEATSELDGQTEHRILETIANWQPRPIVLNISHRQSILDFCDRVWVVSEGRIEEVGMKQAYQLVRSKQFSDDMVLQAMGPGSHRRQDRESSESPGGWSASSKPSGAGSASIGDPRSASSGKSE